MEIVLISLTFLATIVGSISGIGGGVIIKPVMDALCDFPVATISFLSGNTVLAMTAVSLLLSRGDTIRIDREVGTPLAIGGAIGGIGGKLIFSYLKSISQQEASIGLIQNGVMVLLTASVFLYVLNKKRVRTLHLHNRAIVSLSGITLGMFSSFLGIGGGPINIMFLSFLFSMDSKHAAINSLYIIFFSQVANLGTNIVLGSIPSFPIHILVLMILAGIIGAMIGRKVSRMLKNTHIDTLFMGVMMIILLLALSNMWKFAHLS